MYELTESAVDRLLKALRRADERIQTSAFRTIVNSNPLAQEIVNALATLEDEVSIQLAKNQLPKDTAFGAIADAPERGHNTPQR